jgi:hypothetical protein
MTESASPADALLLIATGCSHCPAVLDGLSRLVKAGRIGRLEVINLAVHPEAGQALGVRSVPWTRIGPFELDGLLGASELEDWAERAADGSGFGAYYRHLLEVRRLPRVVELVRERPASLAELLALIDDEDTPMAVRIGIGAVFEELEADPLLAELVPELAILAASEAVQIRADIAHYLGLSRSPAARPVLRRLLDDASEEVREIAAESLALLGEAE